LTNNIICILSNNANTFLKLVGNPDESKNKWKKDKDNFNIVELIGSSDFELFIPTDKAYDLKIKYMLTQELTLKYNFIENSLTNNCNSNKIKTNKVFTTRNIPNIIYPYETTIPLTGLSSNIIRISGGTENQNTKWQVKWKIEEKRGE
jgi:hypothetical protein